MQYQHSTERHYRLKKIPPEIQLPAYFNGKRGTIVEIDRDKIFLLMEEGNTVVIDEENFNQIFKVINPEFDSLVLVFPESKSENFKLALNFIEEKEELRAMKQCVDKKNYFFVPIKLNNIKYFDYLINLVYRFKNTYLQSNTYKISGYQSGGTFYCFNQLIDNYKDDYCFGNHIDVFGEIGLFKNPFGCIYLPNENPFYGWYTHGHFVSNTSFEINKVALKEIISNYNSLCPIFNKTRALEILESLPNLINISQDSSWSKIEYVDSHYKSNFGIVPTHIKKSFFKNKNVYAPEQEPILRDIKKALIKEQKMANWEFRSPNPVYFRGFDLNGSCKNCDINHNIYEANELLEMWNNQRILPIPNPECEAETCRCMLWEFSIENQYINNRGETCSKFENKVEWKKWFNKNNFNLPSVNSFLPPLEKNEKKKIFDLKIILTVNGRRIGAEYFNKDTLINNGSSYFKIIKEILKTWSVDSESYKSTYNTLISDFSKKELELIAINKSLEFYISLLQKYKYCLSRNISCLGLFGFYVDESDDDYIHFILVNNFDELNTYDRLSNFNPAIAEFEDYTIT